MLTFALMSRSIIAIAAIMLLSGIHAKAQFNTVSYPDFRYKVESEKTAGVTNTEKAASKEAITEYKKSVPDNVSLPSTDSIRKEQIARYLSVCYPLSHIKVNSPYGYRRDPFTGKRKFHNGIDLYARNAKVYAMMSGKVLNVGQDKVSGKYVTLQHGNFTVSYCHLSQISISAGQIVRAGDIVGITGNTGRSTGEHLHITVRHKGEYVNPGIVFDYIHSIKKSCVIALC